MRDLEPFLADAVITRDLAISAADGCLFAVWSRLSVAAMQVGAQFLREQLANRSDVSLFVLVLPGTGLPSTEFRQTCAECLVEAGPRLRKSVMVMEGKPFVVSTLRSLTHAIELLSGQQAPAMYWAIPPASTALAQYAALAPSDIEARARGLLAHYQRTRSERA